ncbi:MAG: pyridoxamine 5'-phosphate oxidase family protein [Acidihalobacter sp.]
MTDTIDSLAELEALFGAVGEAAKRKEVSYLHPVYQRWIAASPFAVLATCGPGGLDASPRGDPAGWVAIEDERTLLLPERRGNNRIDSLRNIVADPRVGLLFMIPGVGETLRVNGRARIRAGSELLERFAVHGKPPKCVIEVGVESVFYQCARAIHRSGLWNQPEESERPENVPTAGAMLAALADIDGTEYDRELQERQLGTLY